jgi:anti-anti-sigma factor
LPITCEEREHQCVIRLAGEIDVASSAELKGCFVEAISGQKDLILDLVLDWNAATDLDVTALQLLWAAVEAAEKAGKTLRLASDSPNHIKTAICDCGFESLLKPLLSPQAEGKTGKESEAGG